MSRQLSLVLISGLSVVIVSGFLELSGCFDTKAADEESEDIKCYSGGQLIFEGKSVGVIRGSHGGSWGFTEATTNQKVYISGDCIIRN